MSRRGFQEIFGLSELTCPHCGSKNVMSLRGEINTGKHTAHECRCNDCDFDFLISSETIKT